MGLDVNGIHKALAYVDDVYIIKLLCDCEDIGLAKK